MVNLPKYLVVVGDAGDARAARAHGREVGPLVRVRVVHLHAVHALLAIEATRDVYFICVKNQLIFFLQYFFDNFVRM